MLKNKRFFCWNNESNVCQGMTSRGSSTARPRMWRKKRWTTWRSRWTCSPETTRAWIRSTIRCLPTRCSRGTPTLGCPLSTSSNRRTNFWFKNFFATGWPTIWFLIYFVSIPTIVHVSRQLFSDAISVSSDCEKNFTTLCLFFRRD